MIRLCIVTVIISFCSMSYELLIARTVSLLANDEITGQSLTIGFYLMALGLGAFYASRHKFKEPLYSLLKVEIVLSILGVLACVWIYGLKFTFGIFPIKINFGSILFGENFGMILTSQVFTILIGFFSGLEIPLLLHPKFTLSHKQGLVLGLGYFGGLVSGIVLPVYLFANMNSINTGVVVACGNILACCLLFNLRYRAMFRYQIALLVLPVLVIAGVSNVQKPFSQILLKSHYAGLVVPEFSFQGVKDIFRTLRAFGEVEQILSPYQTIDIVGNDFWNVRGFEGDFSVFLNQQAQFSEQTYKIYHESMVHGALNLAGHIPENILVLGGGDGLIAAELLKYKQIRTITLVELDPTMIQLSSQNGVIRQLNRGALKDPRVTVIYKDAFTYVRRNKKQFSGVFVDFPYPVNYELSKLFSIEFYQSLKKILTAQGFAIFDVPIQKEMGKEVSEAIPRSRDVVFSTLYHAGFTQSFAFGPFDPFVFVSKNNRKVKFNYNQMFEGMSNKGLMNLTNIEHVVGDAIVSTKYVNSIFLPRRFR